MKFTIIIILIKNKIITNSTLGIILGIIRLNVIMTKAVAKYYISI